VGVVGVVNAMDLFYVVRLRRPLRRKAGFFDGLLGCETISCTAVHLTLSKFMLI